MTDLTGGRDSADDRARHAVSRLLPRMLVLLFPLLLGACGLPPAVQIASWIANGFSYLATNKSVSDHGISMVSGRDCALHRGLAGDEVCRETGDGNEAMVASLDRVNDASRDPLEPVVEIAGMTEPKVDKLAPSADVDQAAEPMEANSVSPAPMPTPAPLTRDEPIAMPAALELARGNREPIGATPGITGEGPLVVERFVDPVREHADQRAGRRMAAVTPHGAGNSGPAAGDSEKRQTATAVKDTETHRVGAPPKRGGVYYSLASFAVLANAEKLIRRNAGLSPSLMTTRIDGKNFYRVIVGPIAGRRGKELRQEIASAGFRDAWALWAAPPQIEGEAG